MTREEAIEAIKCNWPDSRYTILREALDMAVKALEDVPDKDAGKMTNAQKIRSMTDEELADVLRGFATKPMQGSFLKWLQRPAEEDDHEN